MDWAKEIEGLEQQLKQQEAIYFRFAGALDYCRAQLKREELAAVESRKEATSENPTATG